MAGRVVVALWSRSKKWPDGEQELSLVKWARRVTGRVFGARKSGHEKETAGAGAKGVMIR